MTSSFTNMIIDGAQVPSAGDQRVRDVIFGQKRSFDTAQLLADDMLTAVSGKRFRGDSLLSPMRGALPDDMLGSMRVINTGFSTQDAQTDETITQCVFAKPYPEHWEQGFVENTSLFCNRVEPDRSTMGIYTVADVPILNFIMDLGQLSRTDEALMRAGQNIDELGELSERYSYMVPSDARDFKARWNHLGSMTTARDASVYSSNADVRRANGGQRQLGYSVFNRAWTFNLFSSNVRIGERLYFVVREVDISHLRNLIDPLGRSVATRIGYPARSLQIVGMTAQDMAFVPYDTSYQQPGDGLAVSDPTENDCNYIARQVRCAYDYERVEYNEFTGEFVVHKLADEEDPDRKRGVQELLAETPQILYDQYMEGYVIPVGYARALRGKVRGPTQSAILEGLRSQDKMKLLQEVHVWNISRESNV